MHTSWGGALSLGYGQFDFGMIFVNVNNMVARQPNGIVMGEYILVPIAAARDGDSDNDDTVISSRDIEYMEQFALFE